MTRISRRILIALAIGFMALAPASQAFACPAGTYQNSKGRCAHRPVKANRAPAGATAQCRDGTYSFSQSRRGTCSRHGGVARWL